MKRPAPAVSVDMSEPALEAQGPENKLHWPALGVATLIMLGGTVYTRP